MKTLTVREASESLGDCLRRAALGEQIVIHEGNFTVQLQPLPQPPAENMKPLSAREALRELQSQSHLKSADAERYLGELRDERQADAGHRRQ